LATYKEESWQMPSPESGEMKAGRSLGRFDRCPGGRSMMSDSWIAGRDEAAM
jgi:hypothetical protein